MQSEEESNNKPGEQIEKEKLFRVQIVCKVKWV